MPDKIAKPLLISLGLSLLGVVVVVLFLGDTSDLKQLGRLSIGSLAIALGLLGLHLTFGGLRLFTLVRLTGERASFLSSVRAFILGLFAAAVTPSGGGNTPGIALTFQRDGMTPAGAWSAAFYTSVLDLFFIGYSVPIAAFVLWREGLAPTSLLVLGIIVCVVSVLLWYGLSFHVTRLEGIFHKLFSIRFLKRWRSAVTGFVREIAGSMGAMASGSVWQHLQAHLFTVVMHGSLYTILFVFLQALGANPDFGMVIAIVTLVTALSHFIPTPGGSGYMEATLSYTFAQNLPGSVVTAGVVAYRAVSYYAAILLGAILGGSLLLKRPAAKPSVSAAEEA